MRNYECKICHGRCDPGELRQGMCQDCREKIEYRERIIREAMEYKERCHREAERVMTASFKQMRMEDYVHG